jgi:beta-lactamase regulating signal transducer with metallopeptidase domain
MNLLTRLAPGPGWMLLGLSVLVQVTVVILVAGLLARIGLGRRAAARHGLWLGVLVWVLASPLLARVVDRAGLAIWSVNLPIITTPARLPRLPSAPRLDALPEPRAEGDFAAGPTAEVVRAAPAERVVREQPRGSTVAPRRASLWPTVLGGMTLVWMAGLLLGLMRMAAGGRRIAAMIREARPLDLEKHGDTLAQVKSALGTALLPAVVTSPAAAGPVAAGLFRSYVVLPEGLAEALAPPALRDVLIHECAHVFRRDPWVGLLQRLAAALYWPHPLVHYLNAQLTRAREEVCDNFVLQRGNACGYARTLLSLTEICRPPGACRAGLGLLGPRWTLADRVAGLLDPGRISMTRSTLRTRLAVASALVATGLLVSSIHLGAPLRADEPVPVAQDAPSGAWSIPGVVVDEQDRPVAGAVVRVPALASETDLVRATSAADGTFTLRLDQHHLGVLGLVAEVDDGARAGLARFEPGEVGWKYPLKSPVKIVVKPARLVTVHVKDGAGNPISGVAVTAVELRGYQTASNSGPDGTARLRVAADAQIQWVMAQKSGAGFDYFENYRSRPVTSFPPLPAELSLTLDGAKTFRIKAVDSKGRPLPRIRFAPFMLGKEGKVDSARTALIAGSWATSDEQGIAVLDWLPNEDRLFELEVRSSEHYSPSNRLRHDPGGRSELTAALLRGTRLSGTVRLPDGQPARGVLVWAAGSGQGTNPGSGRTLTGADGRYTLHVPPEMAYVVDVHDDDWATPARMGVVVHEDQPQDGLDFALSRGSLIHGQVREGPADAPVSRARVSLTQQGPARPKEYRRFEVHYESRHGTIADTQGKYHFRVMPGRYTLTFLGREPVTSTIEVKDEPEIIRDLSVKGPMRPDFVTGVVLEQTPAGERPIPGARVFRLTIGQYGGTVSRADEAGRFRAGRVREMVLYSQGESPDGGPVAGFTPVADDVADVKLVVAPAVKVTGRVVDPRGNPVPNHRVGVLLDFGSSPSRSAHFQMGTFSNEKGQFRFNYPVGTEGEFAVAHEKNGQLTGARTVVSFQVPTLEPVEVTDLIVPPLKSDDPPPPGAGR